MMDDSDDSDNAIKRPNWQYTRLKRSLPIVRTSPTFDPIYNTSQVIGGLKEGAKRIRNSACYETRESNSSPKAAVGSDILPAENRSFERNLSQKSSRRLIKRASQTSQSSESDEFEDFIDVKKLRPQESSNTSIKLESTESRLIQGLDAEVPISSQTEQRKRRSPTRLVKHPGSQLSHASDSEEFEEESIAPTSKIFNSKLLSHETMPRSSSSPGVGKVKSFLSRKPHKSFLSDTRYYSALIVDDVNELVSMALSDMHSASKNSTSSPTVTVLELVDIARNQNAFKCFEAILILSVIIQETLPIKPQTSHKINPDQVERSIRCHTQFLNSQAPECIIESPIIDWATSTSFICKLVEYPGISNRFESSGAYMFEAVDNCSFDLMEVICDYCPTYSLITLTSTTKNLYGLSSYLFKMLGEASSKFIPTLCQRLESSFNRKYHSGLQFILSSYRSRRRPFNKSRLIQSVEVLNLIRIIDSKSGGTILHWAVEEGQTDLVLRLLEIAPSLATVCDKAGLTLLHSACLTGRTELVRKLLALRVENVSVDLCALDDYDWTPLMFAIYRENVDCARIILSDDFCGPDGALRQLKLLGQSNFTRDSKAQQMACSLATIPEFRTFLNTAIRFAMSEAKRNGQSEHSVFDRDGGLSFVSLFPSVLDIGNKLCLIRHFCFNEYLVWRNTHPKCIYLPRLNPWKALCKFISSNGDSAVVDDLDSFSIDNEPVLTRPMHLLFSGEVGIGPGVEREVVEAISVALVKGERPLLKEESFTIDLGSKSVIVPTYDSSFEQLVGNVATEKVDVAALAVDRKHSIVDSSSQSYQDRIRNLILVEEDSPSDEYLDDDDEDYYQTYEPIVAGVSVDPPSWQIRYPDSFSEKALDDPSSAPFAFHALGQLLGNFLLRKIYSEDDSYSSVSLSVDLPICFWQLVLREEISKESLGEVDPEVYRSIQWLESNSGTEALDLTFSALLDIQNSTEGPLTKTSKIVDLKPGGRKIDVNDGNKAEYVSLLALHCVAGKMAPQADFLRAGLLSILPSKALEILSARDLASMVTGSTALLVSDWEQHSVNVNYSSDDEVIKWLWEFVDTLEPCNQSLFLQFVTGRSSLPLGGFQNLSPPFTVSRKAYSESESLPTASTCFNLLKLPCYPNKHLLGKNITIAIMYGSQGFSFS